MFKNTQIAIRYFPRKAETIQKSVDNLRKSGYEETLIVFADGTAPNLKDSNSDIRVLPHVGCFKNFARAFETVINETDKKYLAVLSDDIEYRRNFLNFCVNKIDERQTGYCALYTPKGLGLRNKWERNSVGWQEVKGGFYSSWGGGYVFRKEIAKRILESRYFKNHLANYGKNQQIDHCIPECCHRLRLKQYFHSPSLLKHIGYTSTIGHSHTEAEDAFMAEW